jgi:hypothetical protein
MLPRLKGASDDSDLNSEIQNVPFRQAITAAMHHMTATMNPFFYRINYIAPTSIYLVLVMDLTWIKT